MPYGSRKLRFNVFDSAVAQSELRDDCDECNEMGGNERPEDGGECYRESGVILGYV